MNIKKSPGPETLASQGNVAASQAPPPPRPPGACDWYDYGHCHHADDSECPLALDVCGECGESNMHHPCQSSYESAKRLDCTMVKRCPNCHKDCDPSQRTITHLNATAAASSASASSAVAAPPASTEIVRGEIVVNDNITLPALEDGEDMYSPFFTVNILNQQAKRFSGRDADAHLAAVKNAIIEHKRIPIKKGQLNKILARHNDPNNDYQAGVFWNQTGRPITVPIETVKTKFVEQQSSRTSREWTLADTRKVVNEATIAAHKAKGYAESSVTLPCKKTVQAYHSSLMSDPDITQRKGKPKDKNRDIAENSDRPMLSNLTGILESSVVISPPDQLPEKYRFKAEKAGEGLLLARKLLAEAHNVPISHVHFLPRGLRLNSDDMAFLYSQDGGLVPDRDPGLVLASSTVGSSNRSYNAHYAADERASKRFHIVCSDSLLRGGDAIKHFRWSCFD